MPQPLPIPKAPPDVSPHHLFLEHPLLWWGSLNPMEQIAALAVAAGLFALAFALWLGLRRRWNRLRRTVLAADDVPIVTDGNLDDEPRRMSGTSASRSPSAPRSR
jgi:hypothetical protein